MGNAEARMREPVEWETVYLAVVPDLVRALVAATGSYQGIEDAIHDAFAKGLDRDAAGIGNLEGWLFTVALNNLRRAHRRARIFRPLAAGRAADTRELDAALDRNEAMNALRSLPERERTLLVAKYYVGLTQDEIARALGIPRGTVSAAISRAGARLRQIKEAQR